MIQETNAIIESVALDTGDRNLLTAWLNLDYGDGKHQGFGGHALYLPKSYKHFTNRGDYAGHFIFRCMEIAGVESWDKIKGRSIRVRFDDKDGGFSRKIISIGHIVNDDWFNPNEDFKRMASGELVSECKY